MSGLENEFERNLELLKRLYAIVDSLAETLDRYGSYSEREKEEVRRIKELIGEAIEALQAKDEERLKKVGEEISRRITELMMRSCRIREMEMIRLLGGYCEN